MPPRTFKILTLGCKVNQYESRALEEKFKALGQEMVGEECGAELVIVNTCTVTSRSDLDARALIRRARRENPGSRIVAVGCYAALSPEALLETGANLVLASADKGELAALSLSEREGVARPEKVEGPLTPEPVGRFSGRKRAYLKVQDGCQCFCSYCIVPFARGPSRSLPLESVAEGLARFKENGHREAVLTGIHLGHWGRDLTPKDELSSLLAVAEESGLPRIRLSSLEPLELSDAVITKIKNSENLCRHLHIPLQSGSDRILKLMGRPYTRAEFQSRMEAALSGLEGLCLGFDVIVGFPGETDEDFAETVEFLEAIPFAYLHVFRYSARPGTKAFEMPGRVHPDEMARRARILRELSAKKKERFYLGQVGRAMLALPEGLGADGYLKVRTPNYVEVHLPWTREFPWEEIPVKLTGWDGKRIIGEEGE